MTLAPLCTALLACVNLEQLDILLDMSSAEVLCRELVSRAQWRHLRSFGFHHWPGILWPVDGVTEIVDNFLEKHQSSLRALRLEGSEWVMLGEEHLRPLPQLRALQHKLAVDHLHLFPALECLPSLGIDRLDTMDGPELDVDTQLRIVGVSLDGISYYSQKVRLASVECLEIWSSSGEWGENEVSSFPET